MGLTLKLDEYIILIIYFHQTDEYIHRTLSCPILLWVFRLVVMFVFLFLLEWVWVTVGFNVFTELTLTHSFTPRRSLKSSVQGGGRKPTQAQGERDIHYSCSL